MRDVRANASSTAQTDLASRSQLRRARIRDKGGVLRRERLRVRRRARRGRRDARDITPETLAALEIVDPTPDLLIVGTGRAMCPLREDTLRYLKEIGVAVDACDTIHATSTFNVLVEEGRCVAAALLPAGHEEADER